MATLPKVTTWGQLVYNSLILLEGLQFSTIVIIVAYGEDRLRLGKKNEKF